MYTDYYKLALLEKHSMLYNPCIKDVRSKLVISGLHSSSRVVEWGRDAVWAQPCLTSTSTSWQKLWTAPATIRASLCTTLKSNACCMQTTWFCCPPQLRSPAQPDPAGTVLWGMCSDAEPGQNQSHGVPEEGQVSGKKIPVHLWRRSLRAQHQQHLSGHPDLCIRGLQSGCESLEWEGYCVILLYSMLFTQYSIILLKIWCMFKNVIHKLINMLKYSNLLGSTGVIQWSVSVNLNNPMNFG